MTFPGFYGWIMVLLAAAAMVGTLPGRTQGLGLITESLLKDLDISRIEYTQLNCGQRCLVLPARSAWAGSWIASGAEWYLRSWRAHLAPSSAS